MNPKSARELIDALCRELDLAAARRSSDRALAALGLAVGLAVTGGAGAALGGCEGGGSPDAYVSTGVDAYGVMLDAGADAYSSGVDAYGVPADASAGDASAEEIDASGYRSGGE